MHRRSLFVLQTRILLLLSLIIDIVSGTPYFLLTSSRPKCVNVEGLKQTTLVVTYDAPDMVLLPEDDSELVEKQQRQRQEQQDGKVTAQNEGLDERFNKRFQDRMIAMQRAGQKMSDMSISIRQLGQTAREWKTTGTLAGSGGQFVRTELQQRQGTVEYLTAEGREAPVEVCIQSMAANPKNPSRVALSIATQTKLKDDYYKRKQEQQQRIEQQEEQARESLSKLGLELVKLESKVDLILTNADAAKEREVEFHEQSLAMNRASRYWPMIHVGVLLITGFTIANHMIQFFSRRHIY